MRGTTGLVVAGGGGAGFGVAVEGGGGGVGVATVFEAVAGCGLTGMDVFEVGMGPREKTPAGCIPFVCFEAGDGLFRCGGASFPCRNPGGIEVGSVESECDCVEGSFVLSAPTVHTEETELLELLVPKPKDVEEDESVGEREEVDVDKPSSPLWLESGAGRKGLTKVTVTGFHPERSLLTSTKRFDGGPEGGSGGGGGNVDGSPGGGGGGG